MQNRLDHASFYKLCEWCKNKQELLVENAPSYIALAELATKELGVNVYDGTMKKAIICSGVAYKPKAMSAKHQSSLDRISRLEAFVIALQAELDVFRGVLRTAVGPLPGDPVKPRDFSVVVKEPLTNGKR